MCAPRGELLVSLEKWHWEPVVFSALCANTLPRTDVTECKPAGSQRWCCRAPQAPRKLFLGGHWQLSGGGGFPAAQHWWMFSEGMEGCEIGLGLKPVVCVCLWLPFKHPQAFKSRYWTGTLGSVEHRPLCWFALFACSLIFLILK